MKKLTTQRAIKKLLSSVWINLILDTILAIIFLTIAMSLSNKSSHGDIITGIFSNGVAISVVIIDAFMILFNKLIHFLDHHLEESEKISDDEHKVLNIYKDYANTPAPVENENYFSELGHPLELKSFFNGIARKEKVLKNHLKLHGKKHLEEASSEYKQIVQEISTSLETKTLRLPDINIFTNRNSGLNIRFVDDYHFFQIPDFLIQHAPEIMSAHKTSVSENKATIRLNDASYHSGKNELTLNTSRTCYYHMLLTNRAMDYEIGPGITIRQFFEYRNKVLPLNQTQMGNQIGVEGLIFTTDGYTLIEKRSHTKKTIWRDKFAQPISLSLKKNDLGLTGDDFIQDSPEAANIALTNMMTKYLRSSFGLEAGKDYEFNPSQHLLGISRDLMEGGKPNLYFYVVYKGTAAEFKAHMENKKKEAHITLDQLKRKFYLYPYKAIKIDYDYGLKMNLRRAKRIYQRRETSSLSGSMHQHLAIAHLKCKMFYRTYIKHYYTKKCGESFLGCLAYLELCTEKIKNEIDKENANVKK